MNGNRRMSSAPRDQQASAIARWFARPHERRLALRLLGALMAASTVMALLAAAALLALDYRRELDEVDDALTRMERSQLPSIANSLWSFDATQLHLQLDGLLQLPKVRHVVLVAKAGERFEVGTPPAGRLSSRHFQVRHAAAGNTLLGDLQVDVSLAELFDDMGHKAALILLATVAGTLLVASVMMVLVRRWITRHLEHMARHARSLKLEQLDAPLVLARAPGERPDELDQVASALNEMTLAAAQQLMRRALAEQELQHYREHLEELVAQRTVQLQRANEELTASSRRLEQAQTQLVQSEKMASIGALAAGVAHEINNPIAFVRANLTTFGDYANELLALVAAYETCDDTIAAQAPQAFESIRRRKQVMDLPLLRDDVRELANETAEGLSRVTKIVRDLKDFSRPGESQWQVADLHRGLDSTLNIAWNELKYKVDVVRDYGDIPEIECLPSELNQVFMNLFINAAQSIATRGRLTLRTGRGDGGVWIEVADTGCGIAPEHLPRIFEPFFTTKPVGHGTGLGLALSHAIVRKHRGRFDVNSALGDGTTFRIWLPLAQTQAAAETSSFAHPVRP